MKNIQKNIQRISEKAVISGSVIEVTRYQNSFLRGGGSQNPYGRAGGGQELAGEEKAINRGKVQQRAKNAVRGLINANAGQYEGVTTKFVTLTFAENETCLTGANKKYKEFIQRLNWWAYRSKRGKIQYVTVIEFQKRGAIHYHSVFFNLPYVANKKLAEIWGHGFVKVNKIDEVDNVGAYVTKYMTKENDERLQERRSYLTSRGLLKPVEILDKKMIESLESSLSQNMVYSNNFESDYLGQISYKQYNTKRRLNKK